jgi:signal transduction histidine kinase
VLEWRYFQYRFPQVNRQRTLFLGSAAHELKTPLAITKGCHDLLLTGSLGHLSEKQKDILQESKESCERLIRPVSMFLNFSALENGQLALQLRESDLKDCLEEIPRRFSVAFQRKGVKPETPAADSRTCCRWIRTEMNRGSLNSQRLVRVSTPHRIGDGYLMVAVLRTVRGF